MTPTTGCMTPKQFRDALKSVPKWKEKPGDAEDGGKCIACGDSDWIRDKETLLCPACHRAWRIVKALVR